MLSVTVKEALRAFPNLDRQLMGVLWTLSRGESRNRVTYLTLLETLFTTLLTRSCSETLTKTFQLPSVLSDLTSTPSRLLVTTLPTTTLETRAHLLIRKITDA